METVKRQAQPNTRNDSEREKLLLILRSLPQEFLDTIKKIDKMHKTLSSDEINEFWRKVIFGLRRLSLTWPELTDMVVELGRLQAGRDKFKPTLPIAGDLLSYQ